MIVLDLVNCPIFGLPHIEAVFHERGEREARAECVDADFPTAKIVGPSSCERPDSGFRSIVKT
jgi:hypothetical protein